MCKVQTGKHRTGARRVQASSFLELWLLPKFFPENIWKHLLWGRQEQTSGFVTHLSQQAEEAEHCLLVLEPGI